MSNDTISLALETVRTLAVVKQGLDRRPETADPLRSLAPSPLRFARSVGMQGQSATGCRANRQTLLEAIRRIGLLQLDTINVVARSHYLVMLSRVGLYDPVDLDALLYPDRQLFEQWAHAACLIPIEHYPYLAPVIAARRGTPLYDSWSHRRLGDDPQATLDSVLADIRDRGPRASSDFEDPRANRGTWWDWKPAKVALEVLFDWGFIAVDRRVNFQRYYDLAERVLPPEALQPLAGLSLDDWRAWATLRSVAHLGVATAGQASDYYRQKKPVVRSTLQVLLEQGTLLPVKVEGWKETAYLDPADLPLLKDIEAGGYQPELTTFLTPFDNLIWDRQRVLDLFGFDYHIEMYTPAASRRYGYYVMPILHRGRLVGRLDPKADRASKTLLVRAVYLEPGVALTDELVTGVAAALCEFATFHGSERIVVERAEPEVLLPGLLAAVRVQVGH